MFGAACASKPVATNWSRLTVEGKFSVEMPGNSSETSQEVDAPAGKITIKMYAVDFNRVPNAFGVAIADLAAALPDPAGAQIEERLDLAEQGTANGLKGKLVSSKRIELDGYSGREISIDRPGDVSVRGRIYVMHRTMISALAVNFNSNDVDRFLDSLKLLRIATPPAATK
jgi:hypothetical protein